ncbi:hypothetical protein FE257_006229 [Aspergillus nanangensis]|uniref:Uncharacterized protein n=1 Tax=Aspergillus nanangensis TaxID=2582783 RepID=A0AAD4C9Z8_ASPNN|nr:hypothetical protein FE257_006229 [Aspergillus nanangensis]
MTVTHMYAQILRAQHTSSRVEVPFQVAQNLPSHTAFKGYYQILSGVNLEPPQSNAKRGISNPPKSTDFTDCGCTEATTEYNTRTTPSTLVVTVPSASFSTSDGGPSAGTTIR